MIKSKTILIAQLFIALIIITNLYLQETKIVDPTDPRFNPDRFEFHDYKNAAEIRTAFRVLFPAGTSKEFVDRILIGSGDAAGGDIYKTSLGNVAEYKVPKRTLMPVPDGGRIDVYYDEHEKVQSIRGTVGPLVP